MTWEGKACLVPALAVHHSLAQSAQSARRLDATHIRGEEDVRR